MRLHSIPLDPDPFGDSLTGDPHPTYQRLRGEAPLHRAAEDGLFSASRYAEVSAILQDSQTFSSDALRLLISGRPTGGLRTKLQIASQMLPALVTHPYAARLLTSSFLAAEDPPRHTRLRSIVNRALTPRRIAEKELRVRQIANALWQQVQKKDRFDLVEEFSAPMPLSIIIELLGLDAERASDLRRWSDDFMAKLLGSEGKLGLRRSGALDMMTEAGRYVRSVVRARKDDHSEGLLSALIQAQREGTLSEGDVVFFVIGLLAAGHETTRHLLSNMVHALLSSPDQLERVLNNRQAIPAVVEETLRWNGPTQLTIRRARCETRIAELQIPKNSLVITRLASANRDERRWGDRSDVFDIQRDARGHLAFSAGPHFCVGAGLARLEARIALDTILSDLPRLHLKDETLTYVSSYGARGPKHLQLEWAD